jgi:hypothetical protein
LNPYGARGRSTRRADRTEDLVMRRSLRTALAALTLAAVPAVADGPKPDPKPDAPKSSPPPSGGGTGVLLPQSPYHSAGTVAGKLAKVSAAGRGGGSITISVPEIEAKPSRGRTRVNLNVKHQDHEFTLADDVKVRFQHPPKTLPPRDGQPGYKADRSDLHAGQVVKLYLGKKAEPGARLTDVKAVVTMIMIETDAPPPTDEPKADKAKKK